MFVLKRTVLFAGDEMKRMVTSVGLLLAMVVAVAPLPAWAQTIQYYHTDAIGNVRVVTNSAGAVIERHDYLPFGEECMTGPCAANPGVGGGQPKKFTGKERDAETGLDYFGARYLNSSTGRFSTVDPALNTELAIKDPQRWNRYSYVSNKPLGLIDPDGREQAVIIGGKTYGVGVDGMSAGNTTGKNEAFVVLTGATLLAAGGPTIAAILSEAYYAVGAALVPTGGMVKTLVDQGVVREAMRGAELQTSQAGVSLPMVQDYVDRLVGGEVPPPIKVDGTMIVDGVHRYVAGRIVGQEPAQIPWTAPDGRTPVDWAQIVIDAADWR